MTTAIRSAGAPATSAITSLIRFVVPSSTPFMRLTSMASGGSAATQSHRFSRSDCDGIANATSSAPSQRRGGVVGRPQRGGQLDARQVVGVAVLASLICLGELGAGAPTA